MSPFLGRVWRYQSQFLAARMRDAPFEMRCSVFEIVRNSTGPRQKAGEQTRWGASAG